MAQLLKMEADLNSQEIIRWLKAAGHDRFWLAESCGVLKRTVDNWLSSSRAIPRKAQLIIKALMASELAGPVAQAGVAQNLVLHFSDNDFASICDIARVLGMSPVQWVEAEVLKVIHTEPYKVLRALSPAKQKPKSD